MYANAILPDGNDYTFWGKGVSQGHSDAIRRIEGVKDGKTVHNSGRGCTGGSKKRRESGSLPQDRNIQESALLLLEEGADAARVEEEIKTMPNYFA